MAHDPEIITTYGHVYWAFDTTGNREHGQLVRFDFQQPHGPGSMDHSVAAIRRYVAAVCRYVAVVLLLFALMLPILCRCLPLFRSYAARFY